MTITTKVTMKIMDRNGIVLPESHLKPHDPLYAPIEEGQPYPLAEVLGEPSELEKQAFWECVGVTIFVAVPWIVGVATIARWIWGWL